MEAATKRVGIFILGLIPLFWFTNHEADKPRAVGDIGSGSSTRCSADRSSCVENPRLTNVSAFG